MKNSDYNVTTLTKSELVKTNAGGWWNVVAAVAMVVYLAGEIAEEFGESVAAATARKQH